MTALRLAVAVAIVSVSASWTTFGQAREGPAAPSPEAPTFNVLYAFTGGTDGSNISSSATAPLILDQAGNLYGTTVGGGDLSCSGYLGLSGCGVVFKVDPAGTETVLHSFTGMDAEDPFAGLVRDEAGNLYGTTAFGGSSGYEGTVFKLDPAGKGSVLHGFTGGADGGSPLAGLVRDAAGNLYGATSAGGDLSACTGGCGVVFKVDPTGTETVLHTFGGPPTDGAYPSSNLLRDGAGNLYGATSAAGAFGLGAVFKVRPDGKETLHYSFVGGADGCNSSGWLVGDNAGNLYGTTNGCSAFGNVFRVDKSGTETVLYTFTGGTDGGSPFGGLVRDVAGNLYGTASIGGDLSCGGVGCGVVFKVDPTGKETVLYAFPDGYADGVAPGTGLVAGGESGNTYELYGTTEYGGDLGSLICGIPGAGCGLVFKLTLPERTRPILNRTRQSARGPS